ncbi:hypothetical protein BaRGS_00013969 [Batillaria attramentaria]|uniref:Uncharacterized protein n=1 Tax=Batillaria attramentaria TaxID=370345 RepID=A0ABD0L651_9CAEN|nr:hypothetical protein BaRGS_018803 [Batillaria attramentaria]
MGTFSPVSDSDSLAVFKFMAFKDKITPKSTIRMLFSCFGRKDKPDVAAGGPRKRRKVVVVGDGECGKTCLLQRFCRDTYDTQGYLPTVFDTDVTDVVVDNTTVELVLVDTAGQEDYDRLRPYSYPDTDAVIICFSVDNPDSLDNVLLNWMPEVRYFCGKVPILLAGNKADLRLHGDLAPQASVSSTDSDASRVSASLIKQGPVKASTARNVASRMGALGYWETSAMLDQGVTELFQAATRAALSSRTHKTSRRRSCSFLRRLGLTRSS